jgi:hypothetical protein
MTGLVRLAGIPVARHRNQAAVARLNSAKTSASSACAAAQSNGKPIIWAKGRIVIGSSLAHPWVSLLGGVWRPDQTDLRATARPGGAAVMRAESVL